MAAITIAEQFAQVHIGANPAPVYKMTVTSTTTAQPKCAPSLPAPALKSKDASTHESTRPPRPSNEMRTILGPATYDRLLRSDDPFDGTGTKLGTKSKAAECGELLTKRAWLNERRSPKDVLWLAQVKLTTLKRILRAERERAERREESGEEEEEEEERGGDDWD